MSDSLRADRFILLTPLLPIDDLERWHGAPDDDSSRLSRLRSWVSRPEVREALFLNGPDAPVSLDRWLAAGDADAESTDPDFERELFAACARLCTSCSGTMLGTGATLGRADAHTVLELGARRRYRRRTRASGELLSRLTWALGVRLRAKLAHHPNPTLYCLGDTIRFVARESVPPGTMPARADHRWFQAERSPALDATLERAATQGGARSFELAAAITEADPEIAPEESAAYIEELIEAQVLMPGLGPPIGDDDGLGALSRQLAPHSEAAAARGALDTAQAALTALDSAGLAARADGYAGLARALETLGDAEASRFELEPARGLTVALWKPAEAACLSESVLDELRRGVLALERLERPRDQLRRFRDAFFLRYGDDEVALLEALDDERGIGFEGSTERSSLPQPLIDGLVVPAAETTAAWGARETLLLRKYTAALGSGVQVIKLETEELAALPKPQDALPRPVHFAAVVALAARSRADLDQGEFSLRLDRVTGGSALALLESYAGLDHDLDEYLARLAAAEKQANGDAVAAEILHLPAVGQGAELPLSDLTLRIVDEQLRLGSRRLGRQVLPRLAPAGHQGPELPAVRLLRMLELGGRQPELAFDWGPLGEAAVLPRVVTGRVVLARARWRLSGAAIPPGDRDTLTQLKRQLKLPRYIEIVEGRRRTACDLDDPWGAELLRHRLGRARESVVEEMLPGPGELCAHGPEGRFVHEMIVPLARETPTEPAWPGQPPAVTVKRSFPPGSEWLQVHLYTNPRAMNAVLTELVAPVMRRAAAAGACDGWYFMRYRDSDWNLRLRLHGAPERLLGDVFGELSAAAQPLLAAQRLFGITLSTYHREIGRYGGGEGMLLAERIFAADSQAVLALIELLQQGSGEAGAGERWQLALVGIDRLARALCPALADRRAVIASWRAYFHRSFRVDAPLELKLAERYRELAGSIAELLDPTAPRLTAASTLLEERSRRVAPLALELAALAGAGRLSRTIVGVAASHLHMFANRFLDADALMHELVLYELLHHWYGAPARD